jgi:hypothetical protein
MGAHVHLPRVSRHIGLICMADQWAWPPLAVRVASVACGSEPPATLGTTHMILGVVHKWLSIRLFDSINSEVPDIPFSHPTLSQPSSSKSGSTLPFLCLPDRFSFLA